MADDWRETTLDQLGRIVTGKTPPSSCSECFGGDTPFVTPTDFDGRRTIRNTLRCLSAIGVQSVAGARIPANSVMVSCIGSDMGKAAVAGGDCVTNQQINSIVVEERNDPLFVYYNLSVRKAEIRAAASGSAQPILNKSAFGRFTITLPPLSDQRAIAHILGTLDDKIDLNRRMNATLEAMARALFKSWFVDFDPVRAKAEGRDTGLPPEIAALFPDSFEESELGEVPRGWSRGKVNDLCASIFSGGTPSTQKTSYWGGEIPWLSSGETRSTFITQTEKSITAAGVANSSTRLAPAMSTVIASAGQGNTRGQTSFLTFATYVNQSVVVLTANPTTSSPYHLFFDLERRYEEFRRVSDAHSSRGSLTTKLLAGLDAVLPHIEIVHAFDGAVKSIVMKIANGQKDAIALAAVRDSLLPQLVSGELRTRPAAHILGED